MREFICYKRNFRRMVVLMMSMAFLLLAGCGNRDVQKDNSSQGNQSSQAEEANQGSQAGTTSQENPAGTEELGNQNSQAGTTSQENPAGTEELGNQTGQENPAGTEAPGSQSAQAETANQGNQGGQPGSANQPKLSVEEAKEAALKHAGLTGAEVTFIKEELDYDDGKTEYDIEFVTNTTKYEYEISADDGAVLSSSQEPVEQMQGNASGQGLISAEEAKEAALNHAGFTPEQVAYTKVELEQDDGVMQYEIEFYANGKEYSSTINASTGAVMEFEME